LGLEKPNSGLEPGETNSGSDLDSDETFQISRNLGLDIDEIVCLLDSQLCIFHTQLFYKIPTGIHNSLNPGPELLVVMNDKLPVHVGHYLQDLGPEGGQGLMRLFTDLSLKFAPQKNQKDYNLVSWEARFPLTSGFFRLAFSQAG
jgi:hypothetical protein